MLDIGETVAGGANPLDSFQRQNSSTRLCDAFFAASDDDSLNCDVVDTNFQFWFYGVFTLCLNVGGFTASVLFLPVLLFLFLKERKTTRSSSILLSEFYLMLFFLTLCGAFHVFIETWEWSLVHISYAIMIQHEEIKLYQDFFREINDTTFVYLLVLMTILRHRTTRKPDHFGLPRLLAVVFGIFLFSFFYILPTLFTKKVGPGCYDPCLGRVVYKMVKTALRTTNKIYISLYKTNLTLLVSLITPFLLLTVFNVRIVVKLRHANETKASFKAKNKAKQLQTQVYRICMWVTVVFLLNRLPYFLATLTRYVGELTDDRSVEKSEEFQIYNNLCIFLICIHPLLTMLALVVPSQVLRKAFLSLYRLGPSSAVELRRAGLISAEKRATRMRSARKTVRDVDGRQQSETTTHSST